MKSVILLSEKSAGSSIFQKIFQEVCPHALLQVTRHFENETLFWSKACSILGLPQFNRPYSEVPIPRAIALADIHKLQEFYLGSSKYQLKTKYDFFNLWRDIVSIHGTHFEKSPHHLGCISSLNLIIESIDYLDDIDFKIIGLVRSPYDCIFSQFNRWGGLPRKIETSWRTSYGNLQYLQNLLEDRLFILTYEQLVSGSYEFDRLSSFLDVDFYPVKNKLRSHSVGSYRNATGFSICLDPQTETVARHFGYQTADHNGQERYSFKTYLVRSLVRQISNVRRRSMLTFDRVPSSLRKLTSK